MRQVSSPSKENERDLSVSSMCFFEVEKAALLLKASSHSFTTRRLLFSEKLGFRIVISKEVSALYGSAGAIYMLHLGNFPLLIVNNSSMAACGRNP